MGSGSGRKNHVKYSHQKWWLYLRNVVEYRDFIDSLRLADGMTESEDWIWPHGRHPSKIAHRAVLETCQKKWNLNEPIDYRKLEIKNGVFSTNAIARSPRNNPNDILIFVDPTFGAEIIKAEIAELLRAIGGTARKRNRLDIDEIKRISIVYELQTYQGLTRKRAMARAKELTGRKSDVDPRNFRRKLNAYKELVNTSSFWKIRHFLSDFGGEKSATAKSKRKLRGDKNFMKELLRLP